MYSFSGQPLLRIFDTGKFDSQELYEEAYNRVSSQRRQKVDALRFPEDKRLCLAAGYLLEEGLQELGVETPDLRYGPYQKPYLNQAEGLYFSLSHSGTYSVCAFFDREIGVDIEKIAPLSHKLVRYVCTDEEYQFLMQQSEQAQQEQFFRLWTAKESYMKYCGKGLSLPPRELEIDFSQPLSIKEKGNKAKVDFREHPIEGYKLTVCYAQENQI